MKIIREKPPFVVEGHPNLMNYAILFIKKDGDGKYIDLIDVNKFASIIEDENNEKYNWFYPVQPEDCIVSRLVLTKKEIKKSHKNWLKIYNRRERHIRRIKRNKEKLRKLAWKVNKGKPPKQSIMDINRIERMMLNASF